MLVYHGSHIEVHTPDINYGRFNLDFGKGFYVTTLSEQAEKWSMRRAFSENQNPVVSLYEFDTDGLNILSFDGYTEEWLDFVAGSRSGTIPQHRYDAIYGNIANDDVATMVNDYMRLLKRGRMTTNGKRFYLEQLQYSKPNNQFCIATQKGINHVEFKISYTPGNK